MSKFKILYQSGLLMLSIAIFVLTFFIVTVTSSVDLGKVTLKKNQDETLPDTKTEEVQPKVLGEIIKKDTIYIEKKVQVPCLRNHCETPAVNDSIVP